MKQFSADQFLSWAPNHFVWNLGLARGCDVIPSGDPFSTDMTAYLIPEKLQEGDIIWHPSIRTDRTREELAKFVREILPKINTHFILVLCDGDSSFPSETLSNDLNALLNSEKLIHIFAQNGDYKGPSTKFSHIPIGIDFHTLFLRPYGFQETYQSIADQESTLLSIIKDLQPAKNRRLGALCDFHLNPYKEYIYTERPDAANKLAHLKDHIFWLPQRIPRRVLWKAKGQFAFSISPHGYGLDCHRTWEDLALGCIVIVKTSPLDPLYEGLPVVIVEAWEEITPQNLENWVQKFGDTLTNPEYRKRLTHEYWMNKIQAKKNAFLERFSCKMGKLPG